MGSEIFPLELGAREVGLPPAPMVAIRVRFSTVSTSPVRLWLPGALTSGPAAP
jgi:hypothetical protein